jgi:outer membrane protein TolC
MRTTLVFLLVPLWAQDALSLREAVRLAIRENKAIAGTNAGARASETRLAQAHAGMLPKINYSESFARSDNPVFVFSSLLTQHQFGLENFSIGPLNRPDSLNNFQSQLTVDQPLYDAGQTRNAVKSAELAQKMTVEEQRLVQTNVISSAARAYYGAVLAAGNLKAAEQAVRSGEADLKRAEAVRAAGISTDVDVLSIRVHLAAVTEQRIDRAADVDVAKAALNDALGLPLDTPHTLTTPLEALVLPDLALDGLESSASTVRPEARQTGWPPAWRRPRRTAHAAPCCRKSAFAARSRPIANALSIAAEPTGWPRFPSAGICSTDRPTKHASPKPGTW